MTIEIDFKIQRNKLRLKRYENFNWKKYFIKTFLFLLFVDFLMFLIIIGYMPLNEIINILAISLWVNLLVCSIFTPLISYWYNSRYDSTRTEIEKLEIAKKRLKVRYKSSNSN